MKNEELREIDKIFIEVSLALITFSLGLGLGSLFSDVWNGQLVVYVGILFLLMGLLVRCGVGRVKER